jgi:predicted nucleic acid-binding protein
MFVVDASVVTKWFVQQSHSDIAEQVQASDRPLLAPQLMIAEVADALRKHVRVRDITLSQASTALESLPSWFSEIVPMQALAVPAIAIARRIEHSAYDCIYLALAESRSASLVTADVRLINRLAHTKYKSHVIHLADWI